MSLPISRKKYPLAKSITYLNHGGYGVSSNKVMQARFDALLRVESSPNDFFANKVKNYDEWRKAADLVARRFGAQPGSVALTENVTVAITSVLNVLKLNPGDEVLTTNRGYAAVQSAVGEVVAAAGAKTVVAKLPFPHPSPIQCLLGIEAAITPKTKLVIVDHISSGTGLVLPVEGVTLLCHSLNIPVLIDGAHAPGQVALDIPKIAPDWYAANLHKWYGVPRSCGFLWAKDPEQRLHHPVLSYGVNEKFPNSFAWAGTRDPSAWLCIQPAFDFMDKKLGGEKALRDYCHQLTLSGAKHAAQAWGTTITTPETMTANMLLVPMPADLPYALTPKGALDLQTDLGKAGFETCVPFTDAQSHHIRLAAYAYNRPKDFKKLADKVNALRKPIS